MEFPLFEIGKPPIHITYFLGKITTMTICYDSQSYIQKTKSLSEK